jgi:HSP20 family protein
MANITRFDPFADLERFYPLRAMEDMLRELRPGWDTRAGNAAQPMRVDVSETDQAYLVKADIPGAQRDDIKVDVAGNRVTISAETRREDDQRDAGGTLVRSERYYGQQARTFVLEQEIDDSQADARYVDGVLELTLPKKAGTQTRKLDIH